MKKFYEISTRQIMYFVGAGIFIALSACLLISLVSADLVGNEIESRDLEFLFGAVESGPLEIARLQSAAIAQNALNRIMSNPKFEKRGIEAVEIFGGENLSFEFASWRSANSLEPGCMYATTRIYAFPDSINDYEIKVLKNKCFVIKEKKLIFWYSGLIGILAAIVSIVFVGLSVWPVGSSIRYAERLLSGDLSYAEKINFMPIKYLVKIAKRNADLEKGKVLADLARQVSHDIQSPLSVLNLMTHNLEISSEKLSLIRGSIQRINEIADSMLRKSKTMVVHDKTIEQNNDLRLVQNENVVLVDPLIEALIVEKKIEFKNRSNVLIDLEVQDANLKSKISGSNLSRLLSNLINNSVESISSSGYVKVCLRTSENFNIITVSDNGIGIPQHLLKSVGEKGLSIGKQKGNGLGVYSAKNFVSEVGGKFEIHSVQGAGTLVTVMLPRAF